jgi:hypothetical protein
MNATAATDSHGRRALSATEGRAPLQYGSLGHDFHETEKVKFPVQHSSPQSHHSAVQHFDVPQCDGWTNDANCNGADATAVFCMASRGHDLLWLAATGADGRWPDSHCAGTVLHTSLPAY